MKRMESGIELKGDFLKKVMDEYRPDTSIFNTDDPMMTRLKGICFDSETLTQAERIILLLYCELASTRKLGYILGVSNTTAFLEVKRIQNKIKERLNDDSDKLTVDNSDSGICN
jgi:hypothetical protein